MSRQNINVMIIDSDENILAALRGLLEAKGYTVLTYSDPEKAVEYLRNNTVHIAMIDSAAPDVEGMSVVGAVKEASTLTQIIISSSDTAPERVIASLEGGANDFILKPFENLDHVAAIVEESEKKLIRWQSVLKHLGAV